MLRPRASLPYKITRFDQNRPSPSEDQLVVEEPLEVWLEQGTRQRRLGITMRTPGHDDELALGLLYAEGVINSKADVASTAHKPFPGDAQELNSVQVRLRTGLRIDWERTERPRTTTSACGICGRSTIDDLRAELKPVRTTVHVDTKAILGWPAKLRAKQGVFANTGGLHAAALVDPEGSIRLLREDVGRHNAVDKLVGRCLLDDALGARDVALLVSGRAGFEIVQKAVRAGIGFIAAVGAPSSLAVDLAREFDVTLVGFLREERFNVYCGDRRLRWASAAPGRRIRGRASPARR